MKTICERQEDHGDMGTDNNETGDEGWNKGNRDKWRGVRDVTEIERKWGQKRYSRGRWSRTDSLEIHWWSISNTKWALQCLAERREHFDLTTAFISAFFKWRQTILAERGWLIMLVRALVTWTAFSALPEVMRCWACQILVGESFEGWPPTALGRREYYLEQSLDMADGLTPVLLTMTSPEWPESSKERMVFCWVRERGLTMMVVRNQEMWELF